MSGFAHNAKNDGNYHGDGSLQQGCYGNTAKDLGNFRKLQIEKGFSSLPASPFTFAENNNNNNLQLQNGFEKGKTQLDDLDTKEQPLRRGSDDSLEFLFRDNWMDEEFSNINIGYDPDLTFDSTSNKLNNPATQISPLISPSSNSSLNDEFYNTGEQDVNMNDMISGNTAASFLSDVDRSSGLSMMSADENSFVDLGETQTQVPLRKQEAKLSTRKSSSRSNSRMSARMIKNEFNGDEQDPLLIPSQTVNINEVLQTSEALGLASPLISDQGQVILGT